MDGYNNPTAQIDENITNNNKKVKYSSTEECEAGPSTSYNAGTLPFTCSEGKLNEEEFEYEPVPTKRNRIARKLIQKMRHIIYEYSIKTGEQITGVFVEKPNATNRDYKIYGTKPLVSVIDNLKCSIDNKFQKSLNDEKKSTLNSVNSKLPLLIIDGVVTKLEYFTQSQLRKFIPHLIKYSMRRHHTGWNNPSMKPAWWPKDVKWCNVRYDTRTTEQKANEKWTTTLRRVITECYKYYGLEEMLYGQEYRPSTLPQISNNCVASSSTNQSVEEIEIIQPVFVENVPTFEDFQIMNESPEEPQIFEFTETSSNVHNNVMYLLQTVGPSASLLHPIQVMPVHSINLENTNSVSNTNDLMNMFKETNEIALITQRNDMEVINEACVSADITSANVNIV